MQRLELRGKKCMIYIAFQWNNQRTVISNVHFLVHLLKMANKTALLDCYNFHKGYHTNFHAKPFCESHPTWQVYLRNYVYKASYTGLKIIFFEFPCYIWLLKICDWKALVRKDNGTRCLNMYAHCSSGMGTSLKLCLALYVILGHTEYPRLLVNFFNEKIQ